MDLPRKLGVGIVMLVPAFVLGGALWALIESWIAVLILEILIALGFGYMISERRSSLKKA
ncbi:MAG: hypothetical protein WAL98_13525 [Desulfatiglandaceae bacterium]|jgi:uncharacterized ion transporter superfamily protein YfcC